MAENKIKILEAEIKLPQNRCDGMQTVIDYTTEVITQMGELVNQIASIITGKTALNKDDIKR